MFTQTDFELCSFNDIKLQEGLVASKYFIDCTFNGCDFTQTKFDSCTFNGCKFENCNLSLMKIPSCYVDSTTFSKCKMVGMDWTVATWRSSSVRKKHLFTNVFRDSMLDYSIFVGLNLRGVKMVGCTAKDVYFETANLQQGDFTDTDFTGAIFGSCDLSEADFSRAKNYSINPVFNTMSGAKFAFPEVMALVYALNIEIVE